MSIYIYEHIYIYISSRVCLKFETAESPDLQATGSTKTGVFRYSKKTATLLEIKF